MATQKDSSTSVGWRSDTEPLVQASELEFLRWFYQNSEDRVRAEMQLRFMQETQKAVPQVGLV